MSGINNLTHIDTLGHANMVDVSDKAVTAREALAQGFVAMAPATLKLIQTGGHKKGDVFSVARIAGIQGAKKCAELIPLCHPLALRAIKVDFVVHETQSQVEIRAHCKLSGQTGAEMEALTAVSTAALTIYDMCKAVDRGMKIMEIKLLAKRGGKSGEWVA